MNKVQLKQLVRQIVKEAIGLGVAETNIQESAPPNFPAALEKKLLSRYKDVPQKAYATMWKMHNAKKKGNAKVNEMWAAWESKGMNEEHDETDMNNPEEKREVELAKKAKAAAEEILNMHGK